MHTREEIRRELRWLEARIPEAAQGDVQGLERFAAERRRLLMITAPEDYGWLEAKLKAILARCGLSKPGSGAPGP
jgi:hypothetical protein